MIVILGEDRVLYGYPSPDDVVQDIEALDAEVSIMVAFDERARPYRVEWVQPNEHGTALFGLLKTVGNGIYRLVPNGPPDLAAAFETIGSAALVDPSAKEVVAALERLAGERGRTSNEESA